MFPYDPVLLEAVGKTPHTVDDVLATMQTIQDTCVDGDGLRWFNGMYFTVTKVVAERIAQGGFTNPDWLANLDVQFAMFYFSALETTLSGGKAASCWRALFSQRPQVQLTRLQFALAGVNAHINHDLAIALVNTCSASGCAPERGSSYYADYNSINTTLESLIEESKHTLNVRLLGEVLPPFSRLEDTVAAVGIVASREAAWQNCEVLWHLRSKPPLDKAFLNTLDGLSTVAAKTLLVPVPSV